MDLGKFREALRRDASRGLVGAMRVRLKDVAARAKVAVNTASTILNRRPNSWASKETVERVFQAAEELGYRPNRAALGLRIGRFHAIGLLIADLNNPFYTTFAHYLTLEAERAGYDVVIESWRSELDREKKCLEEILNRQLDGVVAFLSDPMVHREFLASRFRSGNPFVVFGTALGTVPPVDSVISDFEVGLRQAIGRLMGLGHRRIAFLSALAEGQSDGHRCRLFSEILGESASDGGRAEILRCGPEVESAYRAARERLSGFRNGSECPTAILTMNDLAALATIRAAVDVGMRVPEDLSVVGVDNIPLGTYLPVNLSSIAQPIAQIAATAWEMIWARIERGASEGAPKQVVYPTEFLERESTGRAPVLVK
jgi:LacI family transcriptional regulator